MSIVEKWKEWRERRLDAEGQRAQRARGPRPPVTFVNPDARPGEPAATREWPDAPLLPRASGPSPDVASGFEAG